MTSSEILENLGLTIGNATKSAIRAIYAAADDEGTIQAGDMVSLFPGEPTRHTCTSLRHALIAAGCAAPEVQANVVRMTYRQIADHRVGMIAYRDDTADVSIDGREAVRISGAAMIECATQRDTGDGLAPFYCALHQFFVQLKSVDEA